MKKLQDFAAFVVLVHCLIFGLDFYAHQRVDLAVAVTFNIFSFATIGLPSVIAGFLLWTNYQRWGAIVLFAGMALAFILNVYSRFIEVRYIIHPFDYEPVWDTVFQVSTVLLLAVEILGCYLGFRLLRTLASPATSSSTA
ncbi:MAG: hypothetical protein AABZ41_07020 [Bacteroidota bacterium]